MSNRDFYFVQFFVSQNVLNHLFIPSQIVRLNFRIRNFNWVLLDPGDQNSSWLLFTLHVRFIDIILNIFLALLMALVLQLLG